MVKIEKKEDRRPGDRLPIGEAKSEILSYILSKNNAVPVTDIITHLREKYGIKNKKNIRNHLNNLKDHNCIEKIDPVRNGSENKWNITKIENLKNIMSLFPEIQLNKYEKSVNIVLKKFDFTGVPMFAKRTFVQLSVSISFFDKCLDTDIETLCARASKIPQPDEFLNPELRIEREIEKLTQEAYSECMKRIRKIPSILSIADEYIENSMNFDVYQNNSQRFQSNVISEEKFKRILGGIKLSWEEKDYYGKIQRIIKELSIKISQEILSKRLKELSKESLQNQEVTDKISDEIFEKLMEKLSINLPDIIMEIIFNRIQKTSIIFGRIFDHFYQRDVIDGNENQEEQKLMSEINEINSFNKFIEARPYEVTLGKLNHLYDNYYEQCRKRMRTI